MVQKLILKLVLDTSFAFAKATRALVYTGLLLMIRCWPRATHAPNFIISHQDFHIEFVKSVIRLKNLT